jgi:acetyl esterase/lipase
MLNKIREPHLSMLKKTLLTVAFLFTSTSAISAQDSQRPSSPSPPAPGAAELNPEAAMKVSVQQDVEYGVQGNEKLLLDIYQPAESGTKSRPAVILIHGGGWTNFDKTTMRAMGNLLARWGFVAVSVNYRLLRGAENRWPAQLDDVQRAVRWLRANAAKYNVDSGHIGAFGHSAGAQLAALLGMEDTRDNSDPALAKYESRVQAVVDVSGPTDFLNNRDPDGDPALANLFGGDSTKLADVWRDASPVSHVAKSNAPFLIVHGTRDDMVVMAQPQELYDKLQQAGVSVKFVKIDDGHTFQSPDARRQLAAESLIFFDHYLAGHP